MYEVILTFDKFVVAGRARAVAASDAAERAQARTALRERCGIIESNTQRTALRTSTVSFTTFCPFDFFIRCLSERLGFFCAGRILSIRLS